MTVSPRVISAVIMNTQTTIEGQRVEPGRLQPFREEVYYPESHDDDMGESTFYSKLLLYLFGALELFFVGKSDVVVAANLNLYYEEGNPRRYFTPDVMVSFGPRKGDRQVYKLWQENVFPQVVFEIASG